MRPRRPVLLVLLAAAVALSVVTGPSAGATTRGSAPAAAAASPPAITFVHRGTGFGQTVLVTTARDGTGRLFFVDKVGRILSWVPGAHHAVVYLDMRSKVSSTGERGMLGLAFYPDFKRVPLVFVSYTDLTGALQVSRFLLPSYTTAAVSPALEAKVFRVPHPTYSNHNGGMIAFGKDNYFYISTGDGGGAGDPFANSQNLGSLSGKILRINASKPCAGRLFCDPPDNPFYSKVGAYKEIWDYGLRNPWRFSFDSVTGALWIGDVGQDKYEEVDAAGMTVKGLNFGWSCREALSTYNAARCHSGVTYTDPVIVVPHPSAEALIGGVVYRGAKYPNLVARYVFGDYVTGTVWTAPISGGVDIGGSLPSVTSFGTDPVGEIWATTLTGGVYQLVST